MTTEPEPGLPQTLAECHAYIEELQETESALSEEVLQEGQARRHWQVLAEMRQEALNEAQAHIRALEADREDHRADCFRRAREHFERGAPEEEGGDGDASLPYLPSEGGARRTVWFAHRREALAYAANHGFRQRPERRRVWLDRAWREEWSLRVLLQPGE